MADDFRVPLIDDTGGGEFPRIRVGMEFTLTLDSDLTRDGVTLIPAGDVVVEVQYQTRGFSVNLTALKPITDSGDSQFFKSYTPSGGPAEMTLNGQFYFGLGVASSPIALVNQGDYYVRLGITSPPPYNAEWGYRTTPTPGNGPTVLVNTDALAPGGVTLSIPSITWSFS